MPTSNKTKHSSKTVHRKVSKKNGISKLNLSIFAVIFSLVGSYVILRTLAEPLDSQTQPFSMDYIESTVGQTNLIAGSIIASVLIFVILVGPSWFIKPFRQPVHGYAGGNNPDTKPTVMPRRAQKAPAAPVAKRPVSSPAPPPAPVRIQASPATVPAPLPVPPKREIGLVPGTTIMPTETREDDS